MHYPCRHAILLLVTIAIGTSCYPGQRAVSSREGLVTEGDRNVLPLTKAYDPPATLPAVKLQRPGRPEVVQEGVRYAGEWLVDGKLERLPEVKPLPWPDPTTMENPADLFVSFGAVPAPQSVEVRIFDERVDAGGAPTGEPIATVECALSEPGAKHCIETRGDDVGVAFRFPGGGVHHITVWASWDIPSALAHQVGTNSHDVYASWLFKVRT